LIYALTITSATVLLYDAGIVSAVNRDASALRATCRQIRFEMEPFMNTFSIARIPVYKRNVVKALRQALRTQRDESECSRIEELQVTRKTLDEDKSFRLSRKQWLLSMEARGFPALERVTICRPRTLPGRLERVSCSSTTKRLSETPQWLPYAA
jgi:hypothetical protein